MTRPALPLLVGEANPYGADPCYALHPLPPSASGGRLAQILGLTADEYLAAYRRRNLCPRVWDVRRAAEEADGLLYDAGSLVLLGMKVSDAFRRVLRGVRLAGRVELAPFNHYVVKVSPTRLLHIAVLPHPSGLSRAWNAPGAWKRARRAAAAVGGAVGL